MSFLTASIELETHFVHFDFRHVLVSGGNHTRDTRIHVHHHGHWNEKWSHRWEDDVSFILIVSTFVVLIFAWMIVPARHKWRKINRGNWWLNRCAVDKSLTSREWVDRWWPMLMSTRLISLREQDVSTAFASSNLAVASRPNICPWKWNLAHKLFDSIGEITNKGKKKNFSHSTFERWFYLSMLIAHKLKIDAVQSRTSSDTQILQMIQPNCHDPVQMIWKIQNRFVKRNEIDM